MDAVSSTPEVILAVDDSIGAIFEDFYAGYEKAFVLPSERETYEGFNACFALNGKTFGFAPAQSREFVLVMRDARSGERLGGANYFVSVHDGVACVALNYVYVEPIARGRGLLRRIVHAIPEEIRDRMQQPVGSVLQFIEMNDPLRLTEEAASVDSSHSGLGQAERLAIWARLGARLIDHDYVQPPLSPGQVADCSLAMAVIGCSEDKLASDLYASHLQHFFAISVLKGVDPATIPIAAAQIEQVRGSTDGIRLFALGEIIDRLEHAMAAKSLVELARGNAH